MSHKSNNATNLEVDLEDEDRINDLIMEYKKLNEKCDIVISKIRDRKNKTKH